MNSWHREFGLYICKTRIVLKLAKIQSIIVLKLKYNYDAIWHSKTVSTKIN